MLILILVSIFPLCFLYNISTATTTKYYYTPDANCAVGQKLRPPFRLLDFTSVRAENLLQ